MWSACQKVDILRLTSHGSSMVKRQNFSILNQSIFLPVVHNETEFSDWVNWRPLTFSRLKLVIASNVMSSGHLKIKCVVSSFQLYHQSNEVSIETFGIKPTPKSVVQRQSNDLEPVLEPSASSKSA